MSNIIVLPPHIANKIAAGEVVDRPASVVKELVENAIDAEATDITIVISQAGKELIQVIDNGTGMTEEDVTLALERHATSKIAKVEDLDNILTFGFRGEAMPSIASVSRLEIKTCVKGSNLGTLLRVDGGKVEANEKIALKHGTIISVKNLFYNTPARRNFLRADTTEFNQILKVVKRFFLAHPEIHFTMIKDGEEVYNLPDAPLDERIGQVFGQKFYDGLVYINEELNDMTLSGYVCRPDNARGNTANQFIYLNRRTIVNRSLSHAVAQGYGNLIDRGRYPQFVMFLDMPPHLVDVNVHPTKMEVRFANERAIYHLFLSAVRKAIQTSKIIPGFSMSSNEAERQEISRHFNSAQNPRRSDFNPQNNPMGDGLKSAPKDAGLYMSSPKHNNPDNEKGQMAFTYAPLSKRTPDPNDTFDAAPTETKAANLWQVHNRYILSQIKSGMVIIDQHVAHERILYEQILDYVNSDKAVPSQQLLFPQNVDLSLEDYLVYTDNRDWFKKIGFVISELSGRTVVIEAIPADVKAGRESKILMEILDFYRENEGSKMEPHEKIAAAFSCKNAIKSGEKLTVDEMNALIDQLFTTREPYFCPHGRPVIVTLELEELDRKFKRIK